MRETGVLFDVPDGQLHPGMSPVKGVRFDREQFGAGGEGVVSPVGPKLRLGGMGLSNRLCEGMGSWVFSGLGLVG